MRMIMVMIGFMNYKLHFNIIIKENRAKRSGADTSINPELTENEKNDISRLLCR